MGVKLDGIDDLRIFYLTNLVQRLGGIQIVKRILRGELETQIKLIENPHPSHGWFSDAVKRLQEWDVGRGEDRFSAVEKCESLLFSDWLELIERLGGLDVALKLLTGHAEVDFRPVLNTLFDERGRRRGREFDPDKSDFSRVRVEYNERLLRLERHLGVGAGVLPSHFDKKTNELVSHIQNNSAIRNVLNGVWLPIVMPELRADIETVFKIYLTAAGKAYDEKTGRHWGLASWTKADRVIQVERDIHDHYGQFLEKITQGPAVGIYFADALRGFSVRSARSEARSLPAGFILSGLEVLVAAIMYPDVFFSGKEAPSTYLSSLVCGHNKNNLILGSDGVFNLANGRGHGGISCGLSYF